MLKVLKKILLEFIDNVIEEKTNYNFNYFAIMYFNSLWNNFYV